ncbi:MAG: hypothetical protein WC775_05590 [Patescibacteria group bacterium]|jgi:hypothetical protein
MIVPTFFVLTYVYFFYPRFLAPLILVFGLVWDLFWVLPLGFSSLIFAIVFLFLELYKKKYSSTNPLFLLMFLGSTVFVWIYVFIGIFHARDAVLFILLFLLLMAAIRKQRETQKHFV